MKKKKKLSVDDISSKVEKLEIKGPGILKQMEESSTVYKADKLTSEKMEKILKDMWDAVSETHKYYTDRFGRVRGYDEKKIDIDVPLDFEEIDDEIVETGIKTQILFGVEGYEVVDGKITRALTIDEINKLKDE